MRLGRLQDGVEEAVEGRRKLSLLLPEPANDEAALLDDLLKPERQLDALKQLHVNEPGVLLLDVLE